MSLEGIGQSIVDFGNYLADGAMAAGAFVARQASSTATFLNRQWTNYVAPAAGAVIGAASTGTGAGVVLLVASVALGALSQAPKLNKQTFCKTPTGELQADDKGNPIPEANRRYIIKVGLILGAIAVAAVAGYLFAMGSASVGFIGIGLLIPGLI